MACAECTAGRDLVSSLSSQSLGNAVAAALNSRPRKALGWKTPAEALDDHLLCPSKRKLTLDSAAVVLTTAGSPASTDRIEGMHSLRSLPDFEYRAARVGVEA